MELIEKVDEFASWKGKKQNKASFSRINDKELLDSVTKTCSWCDAELILAENKIEAQLAKELSDNKKATAGVDLTAKTTEACYEKLEKAGFPLSIEKIHLPIKCTYSLKESYSEKKNLWRVSGQFSFEASAKIVGRTPVFKDVCPVCGKKIEGANEDLKKKVEKDYSAIIKRYKKKAQKSTQAPDLSGFDMQGYLGTLVELYKESFMIESQLQDMLRRKYSTQHSIEKIKIQYLSDNKNAKPSSEYRSTTKKLKELTEKKPSSIQLTPAEKKAAWNAFISSDPKWSILYDEPKEPKEPQKPENPVKPEAPTPIPFDQSKLIRPEEPVYSEGNFLTKKIVEKKNEELKQEYNRKLKLFEEATREFNEISEKNRQAQDNYEKEKKAYSDALHKYSQEKQEYSRKMSEYDKEYGKYQYKKNQIEKLNEDMPEKKQEIFQKALESKKKDIQAEIAVLKKKAQISEKANEEKLAEKAVQLPAVLNQQCLESFIDEEVESLSGDLFDIYGAIDELLGLGIIYPKYAEFPIILMFSEYFDSGRVTELTGPHGAYNLYESESRTDNILTKLDLVNERLDTILNRLDELKNSQVALYKVMKEVNSGVMALGNSMNSLEKNVKDVKLAMDASASSSPAIVRVSSGGYRGTGTALAGDAVRSLPSYESYNRTMSAQHSMFTASAKKASVIKRAFVGGILGGQAGAIVGALSAIDHNRRI